MHNIHTAVLQTQTGYCLQVVLVIESEPTIDYFIVLNDVRPQ